MYFLQWKLDAWPTLSFPLKTRPKEAFRAPSTASRPPLARSVQKRIRRFEASTLLEFTFSQRFIIACFPSPPTFPPFAASTHIPKHLHNATISWIRRPIRVAFKWFRAQVHLMLLSLPVKSQDPLPLLGKCARICIRCYALSKRTCRTNNWMSRASLSLERTVIRNVEQIRRCWCWWYGGRAQDFDSLNYQ